MQWLSSEGKTRGARACEGGGRCSTTPVAACPLVSRQENPGGSGPSRRRSLANHPCFCTRRVSSPSARASSTSRPPRQAHTPAHYHGPPTTCRRGRRGPCLQHTPTPSCPPCACLTPPSDLGQAGGRRARPVAMATTPSKGGGGWLGRLRSSASSFIQQALRAGSYELEDDDDHHHPATTPPPAVGAKVGVEVGQQQEGAAAARAAAPGPPAAGQPTQPQVPIPQRPAPIVVGQGGASAGAPQPQQQNRAPSAPQQAAGGGAQPQPQPQPPQEAGSVPFRPPPRRPPPRRPASPALCAHRLHRRGAQGSQALRHRRAFRGTGGALPDRGPRAAGGRYRHRARARGAVLQRHELCRVAGRGGDAALGPPVLLPGPPGRCGTSPVDTRLPHRVPRLRAPGAAALDESARAGSRRIAALPCSEIRGLLRRRVDISGRVFEFSMSCSFC